MNKINMLLCLAKDEKEKEFIKKIIDKIERTYSNNYIGLTNFLDPGQLYLTEYITNSLKIVDVYFEGGYKDSERKRAVFIPNGYFKKEFDENITVLKLTSSKFSRSLNHRDYLGSLVGIGIKRETIGDILITPENTAYVIIISEIKEYLFNEMKKVNREHIKIEEVDKKILKNVNTIIDYREINITVSALRLDSIIANAFNISRTNATSLIKQKRVKVDFRLENSTHYGIKEKNLISVKGFGRCRVEKILGETRKGRIRLRVRIYN